MKRILLLAATLLLLCMAAMGNQIVTLRVSRVIDGDTFEGYIDNNGNPGVNPLAIELNRLTIRICGIDAPERGQYYGDVATRRRIRRWWTHTNFSMPPPSSQASPLRM